MNCSKCKTELVEKARYCHACGAFASNKLSFLNGTQRKKRLIETLIEKVEELSVKVEKLETQQAVISSPIQPYNPNGIGIYPNPNGVFNPNNPIWVGGTSVITTPNVPYTFTGGSITLSSSGSADSAYIITNSNTSTELIIDGHSAN